MDQRPINEALPQVIDELFGNYYNPLEKKCNDIHVQIENDADKPLFKEYVNYSKYLCNEIMGFVSERKADYLPYLRELSEKDKSDHDCSNCSHKCGLQHGEKIISLSTSVSRMQSTVSYLKGELAILNRSIQSVVNLKNNVENLMAFLQETLEKEESVLIPTVLKSQKKINAGT